MRTGGGVVALEATTESGGVNRPTARKSLGKLWGKKMGKMARYGPHASPERRLEDYERRGKSLQLAAKKLKRFKGVERLAPPARPNPLSLLSPDTIAHVASYLPAVCRSRPSQPYVTVALLTRLAQTRPSEPTTVAARDYAVLRCADERLVAFYNVTATPRLICPSKRPYATAAAQATALAAKLRDSTRTRAAAGVQAKRHRSRAFRELVLAIEYLEPRDLRVPSSQFSTVQEAVDAARRGDRIFVAAGRHSDVVKVSDHMAVAIHGAKGGRTIFEAVEVSGTCAEAILVDVHVLCCDVGMDTAACSVAGAGASLVVVDAEVSSKALVSGVTARDGASLKLSRCKVTGCRESAVFVHGNGTKATLEHCVLNGNGASGLSAHVGAVATAARCDMLDNKENGCHASAATVELADCACLDNAYNATFSQHGGVVTADDACRLGPNWLDDD